MKNKMKDENVTNFELLEKEHKVLDKIAFEALSGKNQKLVWNREQLRNQLGDEFYHQYFRIGIFVERRILNITDNQTHKTIFSTIKRSIFITKPFIPISHLYLRLSFSGFDGKDIRLESGLCLSSLSSVEKISINEKGKGNTLSEEEVIGLINYGIKSPTFKALWLHSCKLPSSINPDIIPEESRLRNIKVISSRDACYLDLKSGKWSKPDDIQTITEMCSGALVIHRDTSKSIQRSVIELLVEASNHDIPIYRVTLGCSIDKIDEDGNIILSSGLSLPIITSLERMKIQTEKGREINEHEVNGIINYVQRSQRLKKLQ
ncbi:hypothetical protein BSL78_08372 [Apostichopus japonicus]|uniref:Uncharacterized protein n=1 Tax=Stichopus japonicus TaxID=307972 RepID=A0A2G8L388_STIJA|nr:hypothetical protein BSL78_08372 [Apostichopus japonicus]